jgi:excisionase family DNA binding protein
MVPSCNQDLREKREMLVGDLLTTKEAAELLRVSHWTVSAWLSQGKLRRTKAGGRTLIAKADLEAFLRQSSEHKPTTPARRG